eukprot:10165103-Alexandrium_andersonii.AAC.1
MLRACMPALVRLGRHPHARAIVADSMHLAAWPSSLRKGGIVDVAHEYLRAGSTKGFEANCKTHELERR